MGNNIIVSCSNCDFESKELRVGVGMMYYSLKKVVSLLPDKYKEVAKYIINNHSIDFDEEITEFDKQLLESASESEKRKILSKYTTGTDIGHKIFFCQKCKRFESHLYARINYDKRNQFITKYNCKKCKSEFIPVLEIENIDQISCPKCNRKDLITEIVMFWD